MKRLILICNAHLDPVWLWEWEEGLAETLSTFRIAAQFCEEFDGFIFNHNEALLYQYVEAYEPQLFERIKKLVKAGKWHIMGGWFLQPDCNMPDGESLVRQILLGKEYFKDKFNVEPKTAINFDPFGHTRGLVQILRKAGYSSYLFCRPDKQFLELPNDDFIWIGYDGSEILTHRASEHYNSQQGKAGEKIRNWMKENNNRRHGMILWGIGNHGGGPSKEDLKQIGGLMDENKEWNLMHGKPEDYFNQLEKAKETLPAIRTDLNPFAVGCYTSMAKVKQKHRKLENVYFFTEKMVTNTAIQGLIDYPRDELKEALEDLLFCEFHDILPGTSIPEVETYALQRMDHGLEILSRLRAKAFFHLVSSRKPAEKNEFPIFVYNPYPFDLEETIVCEFQAQEPDFNQDTFNQPFVTGLDGEIIQSQQEKESSNIQRDFRKRVVFRGMLKAASVNRFFCWLKKASIPEKPILQDEKFEFNMNDKKTVINPVTGLIDEYVVQGIKILKSESFLPLVIKDDADPWGMRVRSIREIEGKFSLMSGDECGAFAGLPDLDPVRVIEEGPVRTVVEALFKYNNSNLCMRYKIPRSGAEIEIELRVFWMEKDRMLKLSIPTCFENGKCRGQVAYGTEEFDRPGEELLAQKWLGVSSPDLDIAFTIINDGTYGFDYELGEIKLSLLRSPAYSAHPTGDNSPLVKQDRFEPRIDQGEHTFTFWINAGSLEDRFSAVDREAMVKNEGIMALCYFPPGKGKQVYPGVTLSDPVVQLKALKFAENKSWIIVRLFEPTGKSRDTSLKIPFLNIEYTVSLTGFEIKTIGIDIRSKSMFELDLLENYKQG